MWKLEPVENIFMAFVVTVQHFPVTGPTSLLFVFTFLGLFGDFSSLTIVTELKACLICIYDELKLKHHSHFIRGLMETHMRLTDI